VTGDWLVARRRLALVARARERIAAAEVMRVELAEAEDGVEAEGGEKGGETLVASGHGWASAE
jgi:hypothetical protein